MIFNKATYMKNTIMTRTFADIKEDYMVPRAILSNGPKMSEKCWKK